MELRPLGFGEIFDRAVTLYIRNLVPFATIVIVFVLPISIMQYLLDLGSQPEFSTILRDTSAPRARPNPTHPDDLRISGTDRDFHRNGIPDVFALAVCA